jgi:hypothetical protein
VTWAWWQDAFEGVTLADGTPLDTVAGYRRYAFHAAHVEVGMDRYWARYGAVTDEEKARCHHRGPSRWYDEYGDRYWAKVQKELK